MANIIGAVGLKLMVMVYGLIMAGVTLGTALFTPQIAFAAALDGDLDIYLLDLNRNITTNLTRNQVNDWHPSWSPDGTRIAFVSERNRNRDIYTLDVTCRSLFATCGLRVNRLTESEAADFDPAWSPTGEYIVYVTERETYDLMRITPDGGEPQALTQNGSINVNPAWSPDGRQIVFSSNLEQHWETDLYVMDADGGNVRRLFDNDLNDASAAWSPDGQLIAVISFRMGRNGELYTLRLDCHGAPEDCLHRLTFNDTLELSPKWRPH